MLLNMVGLAILERPMTLYFVLKFAHVERFPHGEVTHRCGDQAEPGCAPQAAPVRQVSEDIPRLRLGGPGERSHFSSSPSYTEPASRAA
jgi:hypothetical protein